MSGMIAGGRDGLLSVGAVSNRWGGCHSSAGSADVGGGSGVVRVGRMRTVRGGWKRLADGAISGSVLWGRWTMCVIGTEGSSATSASRSGSVVADAFGLIVALTHCRGDVAGAAIPVAVSANAATPLIAAAGVFEAADSSQARRGMFTSAANGPATIDTFATDTARSARTTLGSNCVPAFRVSSLRAACNGSGFL